MTTFGGMSYSCQCPLCDFQIRYRSKADVKTRIAQARHKHRDGCPGRHIDPQRLSEMTRAQALAAARRSGD